MHQSFKEKRIYIDWLQISAKGYILEGGAIEVRKEDFGTRIFKNVGKVIHQKEEVGIICWEPCSNVLAKDLHIFKLNNQRCYSTEPISYSKWILESIGLKPHGITRIDLALDFNEFDNGLLPQNLIQRFISNQYLKLGKGRFKIQGEQVHNYQDFQYLRFGQNDSDLAAYMYNKTKEMNEKVFKPYIKETWIMNGLDLTRDIWRLEVSIKGNGLRMINKETGELNPIILENISRSDYKEMLFMAGIKKQFCFVINDKTKNKSRMTRLVLFKNIKYSEEFIRDYTKKDHTRSDKIFIRKLENLNNELRDKDPDKYNAGCIISKHFIEQKDLQEYYNKVIIPFPS